MKKKIKLRDLTFKEYEKWQEENCMKYPNCFNCPFYTCACLISIRKDRCRINNQSTYSNEFLDQEIEISVLSNRQKEINQVYQESGLTEACSSLESSECKYPIFNEGTLMDLCVEILESDTPNFEVLERIVLALKVSSASGYYYCNGKFNDSYLQFNELDKIEEIIPINDIDTLLNLVVED